MTFKQAIKPYLSPSGNVCLFPSPIYDEDNRHLFNATYIKIAELIGQRDAEFEEWYSEYVRQCAIYENSSPGLFRRHPTNWHRIISHDEMIGIALTSFVYAHDIVEYGRSNHWCYDNRTPNEFTVYGWQRRFFSPIPYYKARAGFGPNLFDRITFALETMFRTTGETTSGKCMTFLMCFEMEHQSSWILNTAVRFFRKRMTAKYGDVAGLYARYFNQQNQAPHPLTVYAKGLAFDGTYTPPQS